MLNGLCVFCMYLKPMDCDHKLPRIIIFFCMYKTSVFALSTGASIVRLPFSPPIQSANCVVASPLTPLFLTHLPVSNARLSYVTRTSVLFRQRLYINTYVYCIYADAYACICARVYMCVHISHTHFFPRNPVLTMRV